MRRRELLLALATGMMSGRAVRAQQKGMPVVGYLWLGAEGSDTATTLPGFRQGMRELGYEEGGNVVIEYGYAASSRERLRELVADMIVRKVDVIVAPGVIVADAVQQATATIPVVAVTADPVGTGLVASLARPGGNITGFSFIVTEFGGKWVELLHELAPHATRVAMFRIAINRQTEKVECPDVHGAHDGKMQRWRGRVHNGHWLDNRCGQGPSRRNRSRRARP